MAIEVFLYGPDGTEYRIGGYPSMPEDRLLDGGSSTITRQIEHDTNQFTAGSITIKLADDDGQFGALGEYRFKPLLTPQTDFEVDGAGEAIWFIDGDIGIANGTKVFFWTDGTRRIQDVDNNRPYYVVNSTGVRINLALTVGGSILPMGFLVGDGALYMTVY